MDFGRKGKKSKVTASENRNALMQIAIPSISAVGIVAMNGQPAKALILDAARTALQNDLTASGFGNPEIVGLFFGLLEFILVAVPVGTGVMALSQMNRGPEAWLPWAQVMGGSLILIAFITAIVGQVYG